MTHDVPGLVLERLERGERTATIDVLSCLLSTGSAMDLCMRKRQRCGTGEEHISGG
jgi:hypothetical protein